jgi:hypothetical protein
MRGRRRLWSLVFCAVVLVSGCGGISSHKDQVDAGGRRDAGRNGSVEVAGSAGAETGGTGPVGGSAGNGVSGVGADGGVGAGSGGVAAVGGGGGAAGRSAGDAGALRDAGPGAGAGSTADVPIEGSKSFHCVNWADSRDNFVDGLLQLSGLSSGSDSYATVQNKAADVLSEFQTKLKANAIRIPINEPTVSSTWWNAYKAVIDTATDKGMKVVVAYWAHQNGKPDDAAAFKKMWQAVVSAYQSNNLVYFDLVNEPSGYGSSWNDAAAKWLADFPQVPRGRVIIAGTGVDDDVKPVGADSRFDGCLLELHIYGYWRQTWSTKKQWSDYMTSNLGRYAARTIVGEWGAAMTSGTDYNNTADGDVSRSYIAAVAEIMHNAGMGSCYWPGLRNGDGYSMTTLNNAAGKLTLSVTNQSGLGRLQYAWAL